MTTTPPPPPEDSSDSTQAGPGGYPSYPGASGDYPSYPSAAGGSPAPDVPKPSSISTAVRLMLVGASLGLISLVFSVANLDSIKDDIREQLIKDDPSVSQATIDAAYGVTIGFVVVVGSIGVLLWLWMAWKNNQGRSWARVVASVLGGLNVVFTMLSFVAATADPVTLVFSAINLVLALVILGLLWRKESSEFYERSRPQLI